MAGVNTLFKTINTFWSILTSLRAVALTTIDTPHVLLTGLCGVTKVLTVVATNGVGA